MANTVLTDTVQKECALLRSTRRNLFHRTGIALVLIVSLLAVWQGFVLLMPPSQRQTVRLVDGSVVELLGYSFGKKHELRQRNPTLTLRDLLTFLHPPPVIRSAETDRDVLLLWVRITPRLDLHPGNSPFLAYAKGANGYCYPSNLVNYTEVHYHVGHPYQSMQVSQVGAVRSVAVEDILAIPVTCYPQREAHFAVDITQYGGRETLATFQIVNPHTTRPAPFTSEPLPATRQEKDLKVTLESIVAVAKRQVVLPNGSLIWQTGTGEPKEGVLLAGQEKRQQVTLSYTRGGQPDPNWKISELEAFDAMGNRTQEMAAAPSWPCRNFFPPSGGEPYKLRVGIQKTWNNHFDADEGWTVNAIPLPTRGKAVAISGEFRRDDLHLQLVRVYGMDGKNFNPDLAVVQIKIDTPVGNPVLLLHVEDEQGHTVTGPWKEINSLFFPICTNVITGNVTVFHTGFISDANPKYRTAPLKIPPGVKQLKLVFKLPRTHFFEFTAPAYQHSALF